MSAAASIKTEDAPSVAAPAAAKKASAQWNLRMKMPEEFPNIAKFSDEGVKWDKAVHPINMYFKEEEIKEDEDQEEKDAAKQNNFFKKKKGQFRRKRFRKQTALYLEDSTPKIPGQSYEGINYEGQIVNLATAEYESTQTYKYRLAQQAKEEMLFKYVLLQFVKKPVDDNGDTAAGSSGTMKQEINVIPVGDMFNMKKALVNKDHRQMTLTEVEQQFAEEERRKKNAFARFETIAGKLEASDANAAMEKDSRGGHRGRRKEAFSSSGGGVGGFELYGKERGGRGGVYGGDDGDDGGVVSLLGENGEDLEETKKFDDEFQGDYAARPADDEEGQVDVEQANLNDLVNDEIANSAAQMYEDEEDGGSEEEDEEEEERKKREAEEAAAAKERALNSDVIVFDDNMEHTLSEARKVLDLSKATTSAVSSSSSSSSSTASTDADINTTDRNKRGREEGGKSVAFSDDVPGPDSKKGRVSYTVAGGSGAPNAGISGGSSSSHRSAYELTSDGVRKYIIDRGGRVAIQDISDVFMPAVKEYSAQQVAAGVKGGKKAGKLKFLKIVDIVATAIEDPLLGPALVLK